MFEIGEKVAVSVHNWVFEIETKSAVGGETMLINTVRVANIERGNIPLEFDFAQSAIRF